MALLRTLGLSLVASAIVIVFVMVVFPIFTLPPELEIGFPPPEITAAREARMAEIRIQHAAIVLALFGFLASLLIGLGEAATRRYSRQALTGLVAGVLLATIVGAASGVVGQLLMQTIGSMERIVPVASAFVAQACMLGLVGAGIAAAVGLVTGGVSAAVNNIVSGLMAGILVAFLFPFISTLALPHIRTEVLLPGAGTVGMAQKNLVGLTLYVGLIAVALGLLIPLGSRPKKKKQK